VRISPIRRSLVDSRVSAAVLTTKNCRAGLWCLPTLGEELVRKRVCRQLWVAFALRWARPSQSGSKDCRCGLIAPPRGFRRGKVRSNRAMPLLFLIGDWVVVAAGLSGDVPPCGFPFFEPPRLP
jgi:hypothetical protein